jgi:hypothetical protein
MTNWDLIVMKIPNAISIFLAFAFCELAFAEEKITNGAHIYKEVCSACHTGAVANAPKLGDPKAWQKLISEGQVIVTAHGYAGVRAMPPKGGQSDLTLQGFSDALIFMVGESGGNWKTPDKRMMDEIEFEIIKRQKSMTN